MCTYMGVDICTGLQAIPSYRLDSLFAAYDKGEETKKETRVLLVCKKGTKQLLSMLLGPRLNGGWQVGAKKETTKAYLKQLKRVISKFMSNLKFVISNFNFDWDV